MCCTVQWIGWAVQKQGSRQGHLQLRDIYGGCMERNMPQCGSARVWTLIALWPVITYRQ